MTAKLAGIPLLPRGRARRRGRQQRRRRGGRLELPGQEPGRHRLDRRPAPARRRCTSTGKVFLSGPYHGAPLSLAVVTPATAGPFDLGTVVVRVALFLDPETAADDARSPTRSRMSTAAPSSTSARSPSKSTGRSSPSTRPAARPFAFDAALRGGGADPADPAAFSSFGVSARSRPTAAVRWASSRSCSRGCSAARSGQARQHPKLQRHPRAPGRGDANISRAAVTLPQCMHPRPGATSRTICTRVQFAAQTARPSADLRLRRSDDAAARTGRSKARSTCAPSEHELPDLLADLHGQVDVDCSGQHRQRQRADPQHLRTGPRRAGEQVRADDERRQERGLLSTRATSARTSSSRGQLHSPERQAA